MVSQERPKFMWPLVFPLSQIHVATTNFVLIFFAGDRQGIFLVCSVPCWRMEQVWDACRSTENIFSCGLKNCSFSVFFLQYNVKIRLFLSMEGGSRSISIDNVVSRCHSMELLLGWMVLAWTPILAQDYYYPSSISIYHIVSAVLSGFAEHCMCIGSEEFHQRSASRLGRV